MNSRKFHFHRNVFSVHLAGSAQRWSVNLLGQIAVPLMDMSLCMKPFTRRTSKNKNKRNATSSCRLDWCPWREDGL